MVDRATGSPCTQSLPALGLADFEALATGLNPVPGKTSLDFVQTGLVLPDYQCRPRQNPLHRLIRRRICLEVSTHPGVQFRKLPTIQIQPLVPVVDHKPTQQDPVIKDGLERIRNLAAHEVQVVRLRP